MFIAVFILFFKSTTYFYHIHQQNNKKIGKQKFLCTQNNLKNRKNCVISKSIYLFQWLQIDTEHNTSRNVEEDERKKMRNDFTILDSWWLIQIEFDIFLAIRSIKASILYSEFVLLLYCIWCCFYFVHAARAFFLLLLLLLFLLIIWIG